MNAVRKLQNSSKEDLDLITEEVLAYQRKAPERIKNMLLSLKGLHGGFEADQLEHCLQTATRAVNAGAEDELVVVALCHDIGKAISWVNHAEITSEILKPFLSERAVWLVRHHQDFQGREFYHHLGIDKNTYLKHKESPYYELALKFSAWDLDAFDVNYPTLPLSYFEPLINLYFSKN